MQTWLVERLTSTKPKTDREKLTETLRAAGLLTELSPEMKKRAEQCTVTLEEVRTILDIDVHKNHFKTDTPLTPLKRGINC